MGNKKAVLTRLNTIELQNAEMPSARNGEIVVKMQAVGICGSDVHYYKGGRIGDFVVDFPFVLGHECAGVVTEVGEDVKGFAPGDRVALEPGVPCGQCHNCLSGHYNLCQDVEFLATPPYDGCLSNYIAYPAKWAFKLPQNMSFEEGALVEPLAIGINAAKTGGVSLGDTVLIYGAGCIGLVSLLAAKAYGATNVIVADRIDVRLKMAEEFGAVTVNNQTADVLDEVMRLTNGCGADVVLDCVGVSDTVTGSIRACKPGGQIVIVGMGADALNDIPLGPVSTKELKITSIFRYKNLYPTAIAAISGGKIDVKRIVSNRYRFEETAHAFQDVVENIQNVVKGMIIFD